MSINNNNNDQISYLEKNKRGKKSYYFKLSTALQRLLTR